MRNLWLLWTLVLLTALAVVGLMIRPEAASCVVEIGGSVLENGVQTVWESECVQWE